MWKHPGSDSTPHLETGSRPVDSKEVQQWCLLLQRTSSIKSSHNPLQQTNFPFFNSNWRHWPHSLASLIYVHQETACLCALDVPLSSAGQRSRWSFWHLNWTGISPSSSGSCSTSLLFGWNLMFCSGPLHLVPSHLADVVVDGVWTSATCRFPDVKHAVLVRVDLRQWHVNAVGAVGGVTRLRAVGRYSLERKHKNTDITKQSRPMLG